MTSTKTLVLTGKNRGRSVVFNKAVFKNGAHVIQLPENEIESYLKYFKRSHGVHVIDGNATQEQIDKELDLLEGKTKVVPAEPEVVEGGEDDGAVSVPTDPQGDDGEDDTDSNDSSGGTEPSEFDPV